MVSRSPQPHPPPSLPETTQAAHSVLRCFIRATYDAIQSVILEIILHHRVASTVELSTILNARSDEVSKACYELQEGGLLWDRRISGHGHYFYVNLPLALDVVALRVMYFFKAIEDEIQNAESGDGFKPFACKTCGVRCSTVEAKRAMPCKCGGDIEKDGSRAEWVRALREKQSTSNEALAPLVRRISELKGVKFEEDDPLVLFEERIPIELHTSEESEDDSQGSDEEEEDTLQIKIREDDEEGSEKGSEDESPAKSYPTWLAQSTVTPGNAHIAKRKLDDREEEMLARKKRAPESAFGKAGATVGESEAVGAFYAGRALEREEQADEEEEEEGGEEEGNIDEQDVEAEPGEVNMESSENNDDEEEDFEDVI